MAYSDDLDSTYENLVNASSEAQVWNAGNVYFDDEIVEYQGRYYIALNKTSAEVPSRSNKWKELMKEEEEISLDLDLSLYGETKTTAKSLKKEKSNAEERVQKGGTMEARSIAVKKTIAPIVKKAPIKPVPPIKAVNKTLNKKKTLKERQEEKAPLTTSPPLNIQRKMQVTPSDQSIVNDILKSIEFKKIKGTNTDEFSVTSNLILPQKMGSDVQLIWESSHPYIISPKGEVTRPEDGVDITVNLSVNVTKKQTSVKRFFTLWVKAVERIYSDEECVDLVYDILEFDQICGNNEKLTEISDSLELLTQGLHDTDILWASKERNLLDESGHFYQERLTKNTRIRIYAIIVKGNVQRLKHFELTLKTK